MQLKEDYPHDKDPEHRLYLDYKAWKLLEEYEKMLPPKLTHRQESILALFYKCRQYAVDLQRIPLNILQQYSNNKYYEKDIAEYMVKELDFEYLAICADKQKRDLEKIKKG